MPPNPPPARVILHVDMDAFFAAIEQHDRPELRGLPVIIGAPPNARGVVSTCSYEARRFGVHSAMPSRTAYRLCPHGIFLPVRGERYHEVSGQIQQLFQEFTPFVEPVSVDEAFLDITGSHQLFGGPLATARRLKERLRADTGLTGSVGLATNKFLAKVASDLQKPDGLTVVPGDAAGIRAFLAPLPIRRLWGVGAKSAPRLEAQGLKTIGDIQRYDEKALARLLGDAHAAHLKRLAEGLDERPVEGGGEDKSISHEHTFDQDVRDWAVVEQTLLELAERVGARLRRHGQRARTAQLKLRWENFETISRQAPLQPPADTDRALMTAARELWQRARCERPVRLVGFGVANLVDPEDEATVQPELFAPPPETAGRDRQLDAAVDRLRARFGREILKRGEW